MIDHLFEASLIADSPSKEGNPVVGNPVDDNHVVGNHEVGNHVDDNPVVGNHELGNHVDNDQVVGNHEVGSRDLAMDNHYFFGDRGYARAEDRDSCG